ncbi:MAG: zinc ribbon domain-containing protein, partial [Planctomycetota bacterium]
MNLHCPKCGKGFDKEVFPLGSTVACPYCEETFNIAAQQTVPYGDGGPAPKEAATPDPPPGEGPTPREGPGPGQADPGQPEPVAEPDVEVRIEPEGPEPLGPGDRLGGFLLKEEIGRGGMGIVFAGVQESLNRRVAVKVLPPELSR